MYFYLVITLLVALEFSSFVKPQDGLECLSNKDCSNDQLCAEFQCIDPCRLNLCEKSKGCKVNNHIPICSCDCEGYCGVLSNTDRQRPPPSQTRKQKKFQINTVVKLNWYQALAQCFANNMSLVTLESKQEHDNLIAQIQNEHVGRTDFWTSGTDNGELGNYIWISSGRPLTYFDWYTGEPNHVPYNGTIERCIELPHRQNYKMNDSPCVVPFGYICEYFE